MPSMRLRFDTQGLLNSLQSVLGDKTVKGLSDNVKYLITSYYRDAISEYVPVGKSYNSKKYGKKHIGGALLRSSFNAQQGIVPSKDGYAVRYSAKAPNGYDYAYYQYTHEFENRHTPGTYGHWNRHLSSAKRLDFYEKSKKLIISRMNNG